jgi:hypothetical protein
MGDHFTAIGFEGLAQAMELLPQGLEAGQFIESPHGTYIVWRPNAGAELWMQTVIAGQEIQMLGLDPHFTGAGRMRVAVTRVHWSEEDPLEGSVYGWADPQNDNPESGVYPFLVDLRGMDLVRERLPAIVTMQIAVFADTLKCFRNEAEFSQSPISLVAKGPGTPDGIRVSLSPEAFVPRSRETYALLTGHVLAAQRCVNPVAGREFHALGVQTFGGTVDVVADPAVVEGEPVVGGVVQSQGWLSGQILEEGMVPLNDEWIREQVVEKGANTIKGE